MTDIDGIALGRLIQSVDELSRTCDRLDKTVKELEDKVAAQGLLVTKGRTGLLVLLGVAGVFWSAVELFFRVQV